MKIIEDTVENLLCYIVDHYENQPLDERKLQEICFEFLASPYNKCKVEMTKGIELAKEFDKRCANDDVARGRCKLAIRIMKTLSDEVLAFKSSNIILEEENKKLRESFKKAQELLEGN